MEVRYVLINSNESGDVEEKIVLCSWIKCSAYCLTIIVAIFAVWLVVSVMVFNDDPIIDKIVGSAI